MRIEELKRVLDKTVEKKDVLPEKTMIITCFESLISYAERLEYRLDDMAERLDAIERSLE